MSYLTLVGAAIGVLAGYIVRDFRQRWQLRKIKVGFGAFGAEFESRLGEMEAKVHKIDAAVNNVPEGAPSLTERMTVVERSLRWQNDVATWNKKVTLALVRRVGGTELAGRLPRPPGEPPEVKPVEVGRSES